MNRLPKGYEQALIAAAIKRSIDGAFIDAADCEVVYGEVAAHVLLRSGGEIAQVFEIAPYGLGYELIARPINQEQVA